MSIDPHDLALERSRVLHRRIAERLREDPDLLVAAKRRVARWRAEGSVALKWVEAWERWLALEPRALAERLGAGDQEACSMRQVTPFAGVVDPRERWRIWREVREREQQP
jgi:hypothetical protein